nr:hypothetical protein [Campylobacter jejuni]
MSDLNKMPKETEARQTGRKGKLIYPFFVQLKSTEKIIQDKISIMFKVKTLNFIAIAGLL